MRTLALIPLLGACALSHHPEVASPVAAPTATSWDELLARPGVIEHETVVSARWSVHLKGLVNLNNPEAVAAGLTDGDTPIVLPVHVLRHPDKGVFVVDTGISRGRATGEGGDVRGLVKGFLKTLEPVEPLGAILDRQAAPLAGVLVTHMHLDHILGLQDVPGDVPVHIGPGEFEARSLTNWLIRGTYSNLLDGHEALQTWDFEHAAELAPVGPAIDVLGDGSLWALSTPGHTPGSTAYLALTTEGPMLFTGDTCHTIWGWEHGVEPGTFTEDQPTNAASLGALRALVAAHPEIHVFVGHETDGQGTGVDDVRRD